jgi:hypothetical protein
MKQKTIFNKHLFIFLLVKIIKNQFKINKKINALTTINYIIKVINWILNLNSITYYCFVFFIVVNEVVVAVVVVVDDAGRRRRIVFVVVSGRNLKC